ncbi:MAG: type VI secretion system ATPase TssH, partial [Chitinophagaceae bacterium]|nr:type VI secretion system ATPase TssH [Chitinophagaceae bacterium]
MNLNQFTIKAQEAIAAAQQLAFNARNPQIETAHVLKALLDDDSNTIEFLLKKNDANLNLVRQKLDDTLKRLPTGSGEGGQSISRELNQAVLKAVSLLKEFNDEFVSPEHLVAGLLSVNDATGNLLRDAGVNEKTFIKSIKDIRKGDTVKSQADQANYQSLKKYAKNLN